MYQRVGRERSELAQRDGRVWYDPDDAGCARGQTNEDVGVWENALAHGGCGSRHCREGGLLVVGYFFSLLTRDDLRGKVEVLVVPDAKS